MKEKDIQYYQDGIRPQIFKTLIGRGHQEFQTGQQQDAREYFLYLLQKIREAESLKKAADPGVSFDFDLEKRVQCLSCNYVKYSKQSEKVLQLLAPVDSKVEPGTEVELSACLEKFFGEEIIKGVICTQCGTTGSFS